MSRKLIIIAFVAALVSAVNAAPFMFGNFEDTNDGYRDWGDQSVYIDDPSLGGKYTFVTTGATLDSKAVKIDAGVGWQQNLSIKSYESPYAGYPNQLVQGFLDNTQLAVDVTFVRSDWSIPEGAGWATVELNVQGSNLGWLSMGRPDEDTSNPGYPGGWDYENFGEVDTRTMIWDIEFLHDGDYENEEITATPEDGYINFIWQTNCASEFTDGGVYYFDNIRFIPEPMTIVLLGLGGLALRRRKP